MLCEMTKTDTEGKCGDATSFLGRGKPLVSPSTPFRGLFCATEWYLSLSQLRCQLPHQMEPVDRRRDRYAFCGNEETATSSDSLCDPPSTREKAERLASSLSAASRSAERIVAAPGTFCGITRASLASFPSLQTQKTSLPFERGFRIHNEVVRTLQDFDAPSGIKIGIPAAQRACVRGHCPLRH